MLKLLVAQTGRSAEVLSNVQGLSTQVIDVDLDSDADTVKE